MGDIDVLKAQVVRRDVSEPWGFRLQGGADVGQPLTIHRLTPGSPAARIGLRTGDEIVEIASTSTSSLTYQQSLDLINSHNDTILLTVERKVTGYSSAIPHMPAHNAALQLKDYQPMDMTGQRTRIPVVAANPASYSHYYDATRPAVDSDVHRSAAEYEVQQQHQQQPPPHHEYHQYQPTVTVIDTAQPTHTAHYGSDVQPAGYDNGVYASPARQPAPPAADDWMYGCPQSRTFKILQSVMHNEEPAAGVAGLPPPRSATMEQMRRQQQWQPAGSERVKVFMPQQYNSPMGMYSAHNVLETFTAQAESMLDTLEKRQPESTAEEHAPVYSEF